MLLKWVVSFLDIIWQVSFVNLA